METTALRALLKCLCCNSVWNYAVLWKLRHQNPVILSWEDGYFTYPKTGLKEIVSDDNCCEDASDTFSPAFEAGISNGNLEDYFVRLLMEDMSSLQYTMEEGAIGKVASTSDHSLFSFNDISSGEVKCPEEWLLQFASGIKTILLVPVLPHGVLQLGSLDEVLEDNDIVAFVKSKFNSLSSVLGNTTPFSLYNESSEAQLLSNPIKNSDASLPIAFTSVKSEYMESVNAFELQSDNLSVPNQDLMQSTAQYVSVPCGKNLQEAYDLSSLIEELQAYSDCYEFNVGFYGESFDGIVGYMDNFSGETSTGKTDLSNYSCLKLHKGSELHEALGSVNLKQPNEIFLDTTLSSEDASNTNKTLSKRTENSWISEGANAGYLLEHVVARANTGTESSYGTRKNSMSCRSFTEKSNTSSLFSDDSTPWSCLTSPSVTGCNAANGTPEDLKSMMTTTFREGQKAGDLDDIKLVQGSKTLNTSKRRARPADNQKPRPRDRQLIQDRVKELRELVPNSEKCSIDILLDRTVNHMLYLRSVADQADKLRQCTPKELASSKNKNSAEINENCANGASWAFKAGNEFKLCPIYVEDLDFPGCMLIEMLCNDNDLFLEIADTIRGLELTILKGVQESRSDNNTWAQFIVEVSKGFHRLDIFWPLMQLLQRKRKPISSRI